jgi:hypothetical protein
MSNVVQLSKLKKVERHSSGDPNANVTIAIAHILASCGQLRRTGAIDGIIGDADSQNRFQELMRGETAMHELSQAIRKLPRLQIDAMADVAK